MAATYVLIASNTVGAGGASSVTFSAIDSGYTDLKIVASTRTNTGANWTLIGINGGSDTATTLNHLLDFNGTIYAQTYSSFRVPNNPSTTTSNTFSNVEIYIPNYTSSNSKSMSANGVVEDNSTNTELQLAAFLWPYSSAISSLTITNGGDNFVQYSTFYLYGIKNS